FQQENYPSIHNLEKFISDSENISSAESAVEIEEYVKDCWYILNKGQRLQLMGVGVIFKDPEGKLLFEADPLLVHGGDFYGLADILAERYEVTPPPLQKAKKKFPLKLVLAAFMLLALVLGGLWVGKMVNIFQRKMELRGPLADSTILAKPKSETTPKAETAVIIKDSVVPAASPPAETPVQAKAPAKTQPIPEPEVAKAKPVETKKVEDNSIPSGEGSFVIIAGCFMSEDGAKKLNNKLIAKGYPSEILGKTTAGLTIVSYGAYPDKASVRAALEKIRQDGDSKAYIIKH
ncbi:MAG: SPOR domain-containing protein, partial [Bacteroidota bacterium]